MADEHAAAAPLTAAEIEAFTRSCDEMEEEGGRLDDYFRLGDIQQMLATLDAYREIVAAVANGITMSWDTGISLFWCSACNRDWDAPDMDAAIAGMVHKPGCAVTRARALFGTMAVDTVMQSATEPPSAPDHEHEWTPADSRYEVADDEGSTRKWYRVRCLRCGLIWEHP